jgi:5'-AMP-activated protein kinase catalytic alpha subunit
MKILDKDKINKEDLALEIRKEVSLMKMVKHPNIVELVEVLSSRSKLYLIIELVDGGDLFDYLDKRDILSENEARQIFQ